MTEYMTLGYSKFIEPPQEIKLANGILKQVQSKTCLGLKIDSYLDYE